MLSDNGREFCGRPTPLYFAERLTRELGGAKIYLKREDLLHTGAHKINNCLGQVLLARRMGKKRVIAETGAGQHGVATATVAAMFGLKCVIYMGAVDCGRQALNVYRMQMLGAEVVSVKAGQQTLKEAINEAMRDWDTNVRTTHYILGTVYGAHPYPVMVRNFQRVIDQLAAKHLNVLRVWAGLGHSPGGASGPLPSSRCRWPAGAPSVATPGCAASRRASPMRCAAPSTRLCPTSIAPWRRTRAWPRAGCAAAVEPGRTGGGAALPGECTRHRARCRGAPSDRTWSAGTPRRW